jgi:hypothetical protein
MSDRGELRGGFDWEGAEDITALSEAELREGLVEEERAVSYRRRILHGRIDLIRAELVRRGATTRSAEELVRVLLGDRRQ